MKVLSGIRCEGNEETLSKCHHGSLEQEVSCSSPEKIATVICTDGELMNTITLWLYKELRLVCRYLDVKVCTS